MAAQQLEKLVNVVRSQKRGSWGKLEHREWPMPALGVQLGEECRHLGGTWGPPRWQLLALHDVDLEGKGQLRGEGGVV